MLLKNISIFMFVYANQSTWNLQSRLFYILTNEGNAYNFLLVYCSWKACMAIRFHEMFDVNIITTNYLGKIKRAFISLALFFIFRYRFINTIYSIEIFYKWKKCWIDYKEESFATIMTASLMNWAPRIRCSWY